MKIKIINGTYGHRPEGALHPRPVAAGEVCDVTEAEAMRLVRLGVAVIVAPAAVATACKAPESTGAGVTLPDAETPMQGLALGDVVDIVDQHFTAENLARYFAERLTEQSLPVAQVDMYETPNNCAIYRP